MHANQTEAEARARFDTVHDFLAELRKRKGELDAVGLEAEHGGPNTRGTTFGGGSTKGSTFNRFSNRPKPAPKPAPTADLGTFGTLTLGEELRFLVTTPFDGYLNVFNLGTAGDVARLVPRREESTQPVFVTDNSEHAIPVLPPGQTDAKYFDVLEPLSSIYGEPERLLAIVTREPKVLEVEDLHPFLQQRRTTRGGFAGKGEAVSSRLLDMPLGEWEAGLLEMNLIH